MAYGRMTAFQKALLDSVLSEYQDVPEEATLEDTFSDRFQKWAKSFIQQSVNKLRVRRIIRTVLIAAILAILLAGTAFAIPAVREAIIEYFFQEREEALGISFDPKAAEEAPNVIESVYVLQYIPEDYKMEQTQRNRTMVFSWWQSSSGQRIYYTQNTMPGGANNSLWAGFGSAGDEKESTLIGDYIVDIIKNNETYILVWTNNAYFFTLELPNTIDYETMVQIFMSWRSVT